MPIYYPPTTQQAQQAGSNTANYFNYAVGQFSQQASMVHTQAYTASFDASAWLVYVSSSVPSNTTMSIAMPTASFVQFAGDYPAVPHSYSPALEFWRVDQENVQVRLSSSNPDVVFGLAGASTFVLPTSSFTSLTQIDTGFQRDPGGKLIYFILEQSALP